MDTNTTPKTALPTTEVSAVIAATAPADAALDKTIEAKITPLAKNLAAVIENQEKLAIAVSELQAKAPKAEPTAPAAAPTTGADIAGAVTATTPDAAIAGAVAANTDPNTSSVAGAVAATTPEGNLAVAGGANVPNTGVGTIAGPNDKAIPKEIADALKAMNQQDKGAGVALGA